MTEPRIGELYRTIQGRLSDDLRAMTDDQLATPTPACPGWTVKGVLSHVAGNVEDFVAGRLAGPPDEDQTAEQVARQADTPVVDILDRWAEQGPVFADAISEMEIWLAVFDLISHEFDIRGALGDVSHRDGPEVTELAGIIGQNADIGRPLRIVTPNHTIGSDDPAAVELRVSDYELIRLRPGRRSAAQVRALDWSEDVGDDALRLCVFGPSPLDIIE